MPNKSYKSILITGASSGIGKALAELYAAPDVFLALSGRNAERLDEVLENCQARGAVVKSAVIDVTDRPAMAAWINDIDESHDLDLVIANAGVATSTSGETDLELANQRLNEINIGGVLNTLDPIMPKMVGRKAGQIAVVSSMAGFRGMPSAPAYCASKSWVKSYGEGLRGRLERNGVGVSVICPGYVKSRITDHNTFPMPFFMDGDRAARIIRKGLARNKPRIAFPFPMYALVLALDAMPLFITGWLFKFIPDKE